MAKVSIIPWIVKKMKKCVGIVEDTNTASRSIASGNYVIWKGDACKASSAISEGDTLSSSNLTAVTDGVGNDLKQAIANLELKYVGTAGNGGSVVIPSGWKLAYVCVKVNDYYIAPFVICSVFPDGYYRGGSFINASTNSFGVQIRKNGDTLSEFEAGINGAAASSLTAYVYYTN